MTPEGARAEAYVDAQTQTGHLGEYCDLNTSIRVDDGNIEVRQRIHDSEQGYRKGKARIDVIVQALSRAAQGAQGMCPRCAQNDEYDGDGGPIE